MANISERKNGKGDLSYLIRVFVSENKSGQQKVKSMTWRPQPGMTSRQIQKALNEEAVRFEYAIKNGTVCFDGNTTFEAYTTEYMKHAQLAQKTRDRYEDFLRRVNPTIGHIKLSKLQAHHLEDFYSNLAEDGISLRGSYAVSTKLKGAMEYMGARMLLNWLKWQV